MLLAADSFEKNGFFQAGITSSFCKYYYIRKFLIVHTFYIYNKVMKTDFEHRYSL